MDKVFCLLFVGLTLAGCVSLPDKIMSKDETISGRAVLQFSALDNDSKMNIIASLIKKMKDGNPEVRFSAVEALIKIGPTAKVAIPELTSALGDTNIEVRVLAFDALGIMGPAAQSAIPELAAGLRDNDVKVRRAAARTLAAIGPVAQSAIPALAAGLQDNDVEVRRFVIRTLAAIGPAAQSAIPELAAGLRDNDVEVRRTAARTLATMGPAAKIVVSELAAVLDDTYIHQVIEDILVGLGIDALPELSKLLDGNNARLREASVVILSKMSPQVKDRLPTAIKAKLLIADAKKEAINLNLSESVKLLANVDALVGNDKHLAKERKEVEEIINNNRDKYRKLEREKKYNLSHDNASYTFASESDYDYAIQLQRGICKMPFGDNEFERRKDKANIATRYNEVKDKYLIYKFKAKTPDYNFKVGGYNFTGSWPGTGFACGGVQTDPGGYNTGGAQNFVLEFPVFKFSENEGEIFYKNGTTAEIELVYKITGCHKEPNPFNPSLMGYEVDCKVLDGKITLGDKSVYLISGRPETTEEGMRAVAKIFAE